MPSNLPRTDNFTAWLRRQIQRPDPIGDLARDCKNDRNWPRVVRTFEEAATYLDGIEPKASPAAMRALERAWEAFSRGE